MKIEDFLNLSVGDVQTMNRSDLAKITSVLGSAVNKRIKRFEQSDISTPATAGIQRSGGNISVKGKNVNELRKEFNRAKTFLTAKTGSRKGFQSYQKEIEKRVGVMTPDESKEFWSAYRKLEEINPAVVRSYGSSQTQTMLRDIQVNKQPDSDLTAAGKNALQAIYEQIESDYAAKERAYNGDFFEIADDAEEF